MIESRVLIAGVGAAGDVEHFEPGEFRAAAQFAGRVDAEPVVDLIADAEIEQRRLGERGVVPIVVGLTGGEAVERARRGCGGSRGERRR